VYSTRIPLTLENLGWCVPIGSSTGITTSTIYFDSFPTHVTSVPSWSRHRSSDDVGDDQQLREVVVASGLQLVVSTFTSLYDELDKAGIPVTQTTPGNILNFYN